MKELACQVHSAFLLILFCIFQGSNGIEDMDMNCSMDNCCKISDIFSFNATNCDQTLQYSYLGGIGAIVLLLLLLLLLLVITCCLACRNRKTRRYT